MISVIVPVYNTEAYLNKCIDSILGQSYTDLEVLLVDDGSSDGSGLICDGYAAKDRRVRVFHRENHGVSASRNFALRESRGEWIFFADSDDWLEPEAFSFLLEQTERAGVRTVCCGANRGDESGIKEQSIWRSFSEPEHIYPEGEALGAVLAQSGTLWNKLLWGEWAREVSFCEDIRYAEDMLYLAHYLLHGGAVAVTKRCGYNYRYAREGNVVSARLNERHLDYLKATDWIAELLARHDCQSAAVERVVDVIVRVMRLVPLPTLWRSEYSSAAVALARKYKGLGFNGGQSIVKLWVKKLVLILTARNDLLLSALFCKVIYARFKG